MKIISKDGGLPVTGLILTEVMLTIAILNIAIIVLSTIVNNIISATIISRDYLVAQNLVTEGVEVLKNIRDNNWLHHPDEKQDCWLAIDNDCSLMIDEDNVYSIFMKNSSWGLKDVGDAKELDLADDNNTWNCSFALKAEVGASGVIQYLPYEEKNDADCTGLKFYRAISVLKTGSGYVDFGIKLQWRDGSKIRAINRLATLYNYLE